ncbi:hypothetical protein BFW86_21885 [Pseudomonas fluorescens]|nr:hypothetical protein BFW86_21885 [Pseudomonas fluorescens]
MQLAPFLIASAIAFGSVFLMIGIPPTQRDDSNKPLSFLSTLRTLRSDRTLILFTLGEMIIYPSEFLFIDTIAPAPLRGSYYGAQNLAAFGGALSPVICGYLLINAAPTSMLYALGALTAVGGSLCFLSGRRVAGTR